MTTMRLDMVLYSECETIVYFELTMTLKYAIEEAFQRKKLKCVEPVDAARQQGWQARTSPVEMDVSGFVAL